jgi:hypothetical protein
MMTVEEWTKAQAWGCPRTPRNIQEIQAPKLGDALEAPLLHRQKSGQLSTHYIFIASCTMRFSWSVSCFSFQFCLILFAEINGWNPTNSFWRSCLAFHLTRTLRFLWRGDELCQKIVDEVNDRPVGNPKKRFDEYSSKFSLSYKTKVCQSSRKSQTQEGDAC